MRGRVGVAAHATLAAWLSLASLASLLVPAVARAEPSRVLVVRELREHGSIRRHFEELRLDDLALMRQATTPELLRDFGRWQDPDWRRDTLALQ